MVAGVVVVVAQQAVGVVAGAEGLVPMDHTCVDVAVCFYETVTGEKTHRTGRAHDSTVRMVHHYEVCVSRQVIILPLLLGDHEGKDMVVPVHVAGIEDELVEFEEIVSVLVYLKFEGGV